MTKKILAVLIVSFALSACESNSTETESTTNQKPAPTAQASPTPATVASPETTSSPTSPIKAGDKVKAVNGSFNDATVISVDEKSGKVTVKLQGQNGEKTLSITEVVKQ